MQYKHVRKVGLQEELDVISKITVRVNHVLHNNVVVGRAAWDSAELQAAPKEVHFAEQTLGVICQLHHLLRAAHEEQCLIAITPAATVLAVTHNGPAAAEQVQYQAVHQHNAELRVQAA